MKSLQVREIPLHIYNALKENAEAERRSPAQEAVALMAKGSGPGLSPKERRVKLFKEFQGIELIVPEVASTIWRYVERKSIA